MVKISFHNPEYFSDQRKVISKKRAAFSKKKTIFERECHRELTKILRRAYKEFEYFFHCAGFTLHNGAEPRKNNKDVFVFVDKESHVGFSINIKEQLKTYEFSKIKIKLLYTLDDRKYLYLNSLLEFSYKYTTNMEYQYSKETPSMFYSRIMKVIAKIKDNAFDTALRKHPKYMVKTVRQLKLQKINAS